MVSRRDYTEEIVEAARSVLLEVIRILGEYRDNIVLIGGWVPELLLIGAQEKHVGSIDVDLALNHREFSEAGYRTVVQHLLSHGYRQGKQPFIFHRTVFREGKFINVEVDFLAGEYGGTGTTHRTQKVQDLRPRKARGVDLAFDHTVEILIRGRLPDSGVDSTEIRVASIAAFILMKCMALKSRLKEKDAWDIYYCVRNYPGGIDALITEFRPMLGHGLMMEAGVPVVRVDFEWGEIEISENEYMWQKYDQIVDILSSRDIDILPILTYTPIWAASGDTKFHPPTDIKDFGNFVAAVAER